MHRCLVSFIAHVILVVFISSHQAKAQVAGLRGAVLTLSAPTNTNWVLPAEVDIRVTHPASQFFFGSNGKYETGGPVFSSEPYAQGATFYRCDTVTGFPPGGGRAINRTGGSSFIAIKQEPDGRCKIWICASVGAFLNGSYWEFQIRYYSGDPANNLAPTMQIGTVPGSGNWSFPTTITNHDVKLDEGDLRLVAMEVTQAIQDLKNSVPLVSGKRTFVRTYLETITPDPIEVSNVELHGYRKIGAAYEDLGTWPADNRSITAGPNILSRRDDMDATLNFVLPDSWTQAGGELILLLEGDGLHCQQASVVFREAGEPHIRIVPVDFLDGNGPPSPFEISAVMRTLESLLPVRRIHWSQTPGTLELPAAATEPLEILQITDQIGRLNALHNRLRHPNEIFLAVSRDALTATDGTTNGIAYLGGYAAWTSLATATTATHEIAHTLGRKHINCGEPDDYDPAYPFPVTSISSALTGTSAFYGINPEQALFGPATQLGSSMLRSPATYKDVMGYCQPRWISSYTFVGVSEAVGGINERFPIGSNSPDPMDPNILTPWVVISGTIDPATETGFLDPIIQVAASSTIPPQAGGTYAIRLEDAIGATLVLHSFEPKSPSDGTLLGFTLPLEWPVATRAVRLLHNGTVIASRLASAQAPTVTVTSPNGGETYPDGNVTLTWTANDSDGDALTFTLQFSTDGGATWDTVSTNVEGSSRTFIAGELQGTGLGRFRVIAGDGFHSGSDSSDGDFTVANNTPLLEILTPYDHHNIEGLLLLALRGSAFDREDGVLTDIEWVSDVAGDLGIGTEIWLDESVLELGSQVITATVEDSSGASVSSIIHLVAGGTGFNAWASASGLEGDDAEAEADPDGDGLANAIEYVLGTNPTAPSSLFRPTLSLASGQLTYSFSRSDLSETTDVQVIVEVSNDLQTWPLSFNILEDTATSTVGVTIVESGDAPDTVSVALPASPGLPQFVRLKVIVTGP